MGAYASKVASAETKAASVKLAITRSSDEYVSFIENTKIEISEDVEDLIQDTAIHTVLFKDCEELKTLNREDVDRLVADVEAHANMHKFAIRRLCSSLSEGYEVFEEMAQSISYESDDESVDSVSGSDDDLDDEDDEDDEDVDSIDEEDDEDIDDEEAFGPDDEIPAIMNGGDSEDDDEEEYEEGDSMDMEQRDLDEPLFPGAEIEEYEDLLNDDECLHAARYASQGILAQYESEMNSIGLPNKVLESRLVTMRKMLFDAAEVIVEEAVNRFVQNYYADAITDMQVRLSIAEEEMDFATADMESIVATIAEIASIGAVARQALEDLPFTRRDAIASVSEDLANEVEEIINQVSYVNIDRQEVVEALADLDIDDFYEDEDDDEDTEGGESTEEEASEEEQEEPVVNKSSRSKAAAKKSNSSSSLTKPATKSKAAEKPKAAPKAAPKASPKASPKEKVSNNKRKTPDTTESETTGRRSTRSRK